MNNWAEKLHPLIEKYRGYKHPLDYNNRYQLLVMVVLAAQASDNQINRIAPEFFKSFPTISDLKDKNPEDLFPFLSSVRGYRKKSAWLVGAAKVIVEDSKIPTKLEELTKLPGIGRKTANTIIRESGDKAQGVIVDLHVIRVSSRLGISDEKPDKIEKSLMEEFPRENWNEIGMALSFHGREICRPKPMCEQCIVNQVCSYFNTVVKKENAVPLQHS